MEDDQNNLDQYLDVSYTSNRQDPPSRPQAHQAFNNPSTMMASSGLNQSAMGGYFPPGPAPAASDPSNMMMSMMQMMNHPMFMMMQQQYQMMMQQQQIGVPQPVSKPTPTAYSNPSVSQYQPPTRPPAQSYMNSTIPSSNPYTIDSQSGVYDQPLLRTGAAVLQNNNTYYPVRTQPESEPTTKIQQPAPSKVSIRNPRANTMTNPSVAASAFDSMKSPINSSNFSEDAQNSKRPRFYRKEPESVPDTTAADSGRLQVAALSGNPSERSLRPEPDSNRPDFSKRQVTKNTTASISTHLDDERPIKPASNLSSYYNPPVLENKSAAAQHAPVSFDDMPIRPAKGPFFDPMEERPIRPAAKMPPRFQTGGDDHREIVDTSRNEFLEEQNMGAYRNKPKAPVVRNNPRPQPKPQANPDDERPIAGGQKDFDQMLKEQLRNEQLQKKRQQQRNNPNVSQEQRDGAPKPHNFLKRRSREFLSSAKSRYETSNDPNRSRLKETHQAEQKKPVIPKNIPKAPKTTTSNGSNVYTSTANTGKTNRNEGIFIDTQEREQVMDRFGSNTLTKNNPTIQTNAGRSNNFKSQEPKKKQSVPQNLFDDSGVESEEDKVEVIRGIKLSGDDMERLKYHFLSQEEIIIQEKQHVQSMRQKYEELLMNLETQRNKLREEFQREKEAFEEYKKEQMKKIKNEKRIAERQKQAVCSGTGKKDKEEFETLKKEWDKEREELKKKEANNKILIEKQKKELEELKRIAGSQNRYSEDTLTTAPSANLRASVNPSSLQSVKEDRPIEINSRKNVQNQSAGNTAAKPNIAAKKPLASMDQGDQRDKLTDMQFKVSKPAKKETTVPTIPDYDEIRVGGKNSRTEENQQSSRAGTQNSSNNYLDPYIRNGSTATTGLTASKHLDAKSHTLSTDYIKKPTTLLNNQITGGNAWKNQYNNSYNQDAYEEADNNNQQEQQASNDSSFCEYTPDMSIQDLATIKLSIKMVTEEMVDNLFHHDSNKYYRAYQQLKRRPRQAKSIEDGKGGKVIRTYTDGSKEIVFDHGVRKETMPDGYTIIHFANRDIKQKLPDGTVLYYFNEKQVDQITLNSKVNIFRFDNNQVEFHYPDGKVEIRHADGTIKVQSK